MKAVAKVQGSPLRVLIIEDNVAVAKVVGEAFREAGHCIVGYARSVEESLVLIVDCKFDIALLDVDLRGSQSDVAAVELEKQRVPFVVMAGSEGMLTSAHASAPIVLKPFRIHDLLETARRAAVGLRT